MSPFPLEGGSYRVIDGVLVREHEAQQDHDQSQDTVGATAAPADQSFFRRRKTTED